MTKKKIKINLSVESVNKGTGNISVDGEPFNDGKNTENIKIKARRR